MRFDECASSYDDHALPQRVFAARVAAFIGEPPAGKALEMGAGTGALTRCLAGRPGVRWVATDSSPAMLAIGQRAAPQAEWALLDAFREPIPTADLQVSSGLLQWAPDPGQALARWAAAVRSGGRMVHAFPCEPCLREWRSLVPHGPLRWRSEVEWQKLFAQAGLEILRSQAWKDTAVLRSALDLVRGLHHSGVTGRPQLTPGRLRAALRTYDARFCTAGGVAATWAWMVIEARPGKS